VNAAFEVLTTAEADADADEALAFYDRISPSLGDRFLSEYKGRIAHLAMGWAWHQIRYRNVRFAKIPHFPYSVHFMVNEGKQRVRVIAVLHERRRPRG
jgi:plasmid stabilization system protein ParE